MASELLLHATADVTTTVTVTATATATVTVTVTDANIIANFNHDCYHFNH